VLSFETSAKTNVGITEACTAVAQRILQDIKRTAPEKGEQTRERDGHYNASS
jgi:hypothetical protein